MRIKFGSFFANVWARGFLRNFRKEVTPLVADVKSLESEVRQHTQNVFDQRVDALPDKKGRMILAMCSLVLASYEQLKNCLDDPALAYDAVQRAFKKTAATPMKWWFRLWLWLFRDPVGNLQDRSMAAHGERMYGKSMEFADEKTETPWTCW